MFNACIICHKKKVKCDLTDHHPCSNCIKGDAECLPYKRKRKRYTNSLSPRDSHSELGTTIARETRPYRPTASSPATIAPVPVTRGECIQTYRGRDRYLGRHVPFDEAMITNNPTRGDMGVCDSDVQLLTQQGAYILPHPVVQEELIAVFMKFGDVWTPIIDPAWLSGDAVSHLLLQALFLAASRMVKHPIRDTHSADFYRRAKLLFFFGHERDPLILIASAILLHWYNPVGPETISTDTSGFWLRTAESIAFQIGLHKEPSAQSEKRGLRRRLWWTLVLRDCIIAAGVGRPRAINLSDSDVLPPSLGDFAVPDMNARLFLVYVPICQFLGDIVESCLRRQLLPSQQRMLENSLYRWIKQDFPTLTTSLPSTSFEARQVLVTYLVTLIILDRTPTPDGFPGARSIVASSFVAGIFREFLEREELCRLGPAFTFYALCAGLALLPAYRCDALRSVASEETLVLKASLQVLSQQWRSAFGALRALQKLTEYISSQPTIDGCGPCLGGEMASFFEGLDLRTCRLWELSLERHVIDAPSGDLLPTIPTHEENAPEPQGSGLEYPGNLGDGLDVLSGDWEGLGFDWSGSWLLHSSIG